MEIVFDDGTFGLVREGETVKLVDLRYGWAVSKGSANLIIRDGVIVEIIPNGDLTVTEEDMSETLFCGREDF